MNEILKVRQRIKNFSGSFQTHQNRHHVDPVTHTLNHDSQVQLSDALKSDVFREKGRHKPETLNLNPDHVIRAENGEKHPKIDESFVERYKHQIAKMLNAAGRPDSLNDASDPLNADFQADFASFLEYQKQNQDSLNKGNSDAAKSGFVHYPTEPSATPNDVKKDKSGMTQTMTEGNNRLNTDATLPDTQPLSQKDLKEAKPAFQHQNLPSKPPPTDTNFLMVPKTLKDVLQMPSYMKLSDFVNDGRPVTDRPQFGRYIDELIKPVPSKTSEAFPPHEIAPGDKKTPLHIRTDSIPQGNPFANPISEVDQKTPQKTPKDPEILQPILTTPKNGDTTERLIDQFTHEKTKDQNLTISRLTSLKEANDNPIFPPVYLPPDTSSDAQSSSANKQPQIASTQQQLPGSATDNSLQQSQTKTATFPSNGISNSLQLSDVKNPKPAKDEAAGLYKSSPQKTDSVATFGEPQKPVTNKTTPIDKLPLKDEFNPYPQVPKDLPANYADLYHQPFPSSPYEFGRQQQAFAPNYNQNIHRTLTYDGRPNPQIYSPVMPKLGRYEEEQPFDNFTKVYPQQVLQDQFSHRSADNLKKKQTPKQQDSKPIFLSQNPKRTLTKIFSYLQRAPKNKDRFSTKSVSKIREIGAYFVKERAQNTRKLRTSKSPQPTLLQMHTATAAYLQRKDSKSESEITALREERAQLTAKIEQMNLMLAERGIKGQQTSAFTKPKSQLKVDKVATFQIQKSENSQINHVRDLTNFPHLLFQSKEDPVQLSGHLTNYRPQEVHARTLSNIGLNRQISFDNHEGKFSNGNQPNEVKFLNISIAKLQQDVDFLNQQISIAEMERNNANFVYKKSCAEIKDLRNEIGILKSNISNQKATIAQLTDAIIQEGDEKLTEQVSKILNSKSGQ